MANQPKGSKGSARTSTGSTKAERASRRAEVAAELRRQQVREQRRSRLIMASSVVIAIVIVVGAVVAIGLNHGPKSGKASTLAPAAVVSAVTGVPTSVFNSIGPGTADNPPTAIKGGTALTQGGKPRILYVGAEYCPYCAADRWGLVAALSRFGTFKNLGVTHSASGDVYANTPTLSFHGASYTSKYIVFKGYERQSNKISGGSYADLDTLSKSDLALFDKYDNPPYVQSSAAGTIPFIDWGGLYLTSGASYLPTMLAGKTHLQVAQAMSDPTSSAAKAIDGTANVFTAMICKLTKGQPANVCGSAGVTAAASKIK